MPFCILETDNGWTVAEMLPEQMAADVALQLGATVIDPGPYDDYDEANDALEALAGELAEDGGTSDAPTTRVIESRDEE